LWPTHAASIQCALGKPLCARLNFVNPPEPVSTTRPMPLRRSKSAHLVALTAAPSFKGAFACAFTSAESLPRTHSYSSCDNSFFASLCLRQSHTRLLTRFEPPPDRGTT